MHSVTRRTVFTDDVIGRQTRIHHKISSSHLFKGVDIFMANSDPAVIINAPILPPPVKHQTILSVFDALPQGFTALLINDHDPKPLLYQLEAEQPGVFSINYQEQGPERFAILVTKD